METHFVSLWKAPSPQCIDPIRELTEGFDAQQYPGEGVFFAGLLAIAQDFQRRYQNGLQEISLPGEVFKELIDRGVIVPDHYYPEEQSWHVPEVRLSEFNEVLRQAATGRYYPQPF